MQSLNSIDKVVDLRVSKNFARIRTCQKGLHSFLDLNIESRFGIIFTDMFDDLVIVVHAKAGHSETMLYSCCS